MLGALIGAGASLASSLLGKKSNEKAQQSNIQQQERFAQNAIQWKTQDAEKAGIHPLYALGANTVSFQPTAVGSDFSGIASAGQDIGRAVDAAATGSQRVATNALTKLQLEGLGLDNDIKRAELASKLRTHQAVGPALPGPDSRYLIDGQGQTGLWDQPLTEEFKRSPGMPGSPYASAEYGTVSDIGYSRTPTGGYAVTPSQDVKNRIEDQLLPELGWAARNLVAPMFSDKYYNPPPVDLEPGYRWEFNPVTQEYYQAYAGRHARWRWK